MTKKSESLFLLKGFLILVVFCILGGIIYAAQLFYKKEYEAKKSTIIREISAIKEFSPEEAAAEKGWTYPPETPKKSLEQIRIEINKYIAEQINELYPKKDLFAKKAEIIKKYRPAQLGEKIRFQLNTSNNIIEGIYQGKEGLSIKVDDKRYKIIDVLDEFRYLFNEALAEKITQDKIKELDDEYQRKIDEFSAKTEKIEIEKRCPEAGYVKISEGLWKHQSTLIEEYIEKRRKEYQNEKQKQIQDIYNKNKLFGLIPVTDTEIEKLMKEEKRDAR